MVETTIRNFKKFFLLFLFVVSIYSCSDTPEDKDGDDQPTSLKPAVDIGNSEVPYIFVNTKAQQIQYGPKINGTMTIFEKGKPEVKYNVGIDYRGKTSYRISAKKPYGIEIRDDKGADKLASIFGFPEESDWILNNTVINPATKSVIDRTLMYNHIGYELARSIGRYASRTKFVELEVNGVYLGVYTFMEKLKRGKSRININNLNPTSSNITGGYIIKIDKSSIGEAAIGKPLSYFDNNWGDDATYTARNSFRSRFDINGRVMTSAPFGPPYHPNMYLETYFLYEDPDEATITPAQKSYIQGYVDQFETALAAETFANNTRKYTDFIDLPSFVDYFILNELFRNIDAYRLSTYLQKDKDSKLAMGPIWDLNIGFDEGGRIPMNEWVINYNKVVTSDPWMMPFWWPKVLQDPQFKELVKTRWTTLRSKELSTATMLALVDTNASYLKSNGASGRNYVKWDLGLNINYDQSIINLKNFLRDRSAWMDGQIASF
jgi:hypothetical protein